MKRFIIALLVTSLFVGCSQNESREELAEVTKIEFSGVKSIPLGMSADFSFDDLTDEYLYIAISMITPVLDSEIFVRATPRYLGGKTYLSLVDQMPMGKMVLDCIIYKGEEITDWEGEYQSVVKPIGLEVEITEMDFYVDGSFIDDIVWFDGEGTKDSPYLIECSTDLLTLKLLVNNPEYSEEYDTKWYKQTKDLDMAYVCNYENLEYGWIPIGEVPAKCFRGHYLGDGYSIKNLKINRNSTVGVGLFGYVCGADIENLMIEESSIIGSGGAGSFIGTIVGNAGDFMASEESVATYILECKVDDTHVESGLCAGGMVGAVDANSLLVIQNCATGDGTTVSGIMNVGGIIGGGLYSSSILITSCDNNSTVKCTKICAGGIIGGADSAIVFNCNNYAPVSITETLPTGMDYSEVDISSYKTIAAGGIVGGGSQVKVIACMNESAITGFRGVGGIFGSSLLDSDDGTEEDSDLYNSIFLSHCVNNSVVSGSDHVGGLIGEGQPAVLESANFGDVKGSGDYVGGITGYAPISAFGLSYNAANIAGNSYVGGICGNTQFSSSFLVNNYSDITSEDGFAGGIFGKAGADALINYCSNTADVSSKLDNNPVGGLIGELGKPRDVKQEAVNVILSILTTAAQSTNYLGSSWFVKGNIAEVTGTVLKDVNMKNKNIASFTFTIISIACSGAKIALNIVWKKSAQTYYSGVDYCDIESQMTERCEEIGSELISRSSNYMARAQFSLPDSIAQYDLMSDQVSNFEVMYDFFHSTLDDDDKSERCQAVSSSLNIRRLEMEEEVEKDQQPTKIALGIVSGVLSVACLATGIGATVLTAKRMAVSTIVALNMAATLTSLGNAASSIISTVCDHERNSAEASQCFNVGQISGGKECGGIIGYLADNAHVEDCMNFGKADNGNDKKMGAIVGSAGESVAIQRNCSINSDMPQLYGSDGVGSDDISDNIILTKYDNTIYDSATYTNWDFDLVWDLPYQNESLEAVPPVLQRVKYYVYSDTDTDNE